MYGNVHVGRKVRFDLGEGSRHEIVIWSCCACGGCPPVDHDAVRRRSAAVSANRRPLHLASQRHRRRTETRGDTATQPRGQHRRRSPDGAGHSLVRSGSHSGACSNSHPDAAVSAGVGDGEACRARANQQQLHRWMPDEFQVRQPALERMLHDRRRFLGDLQKCAQFQNLRRVLRVRAVYRLAPERSLVVLHQPSRRKIQGRRTQATRTLAPGLRQIGSGKIQGRAG